MGTAVLGRRNLEPSVRELEVLGCAAEGLNNAEIGRALHISEETVKSHLRTVYWKLGVRSRAHAVAIALRKGLIE